MADRTEAQKQQAKERMAKVRAGRGKVEAPATLPNDGSAGRLDSLEASIASLVDVVTPLAEAVSGLQRSQGQLLRTSTPEKRIEEVNARTVAQQAAQSPERAASGRTTIDQNHPRAHLTGLQANDVVRLADDSPKKAQIRSSRQASPDWDGQGVILSFMHVAKDGQRKYKCQFPGIGKDGVLEGELELVSA